MNVLRPYAKAILGFLAPGAVTITAAVLETSDGGTRVTTAEWVTAVCACLISGAAVYAVPNTPKDDKADQ